ncbi:MAG: TIM barrel protein [Acidobacteriaceae bacterium]
MNRREFGRIVAGTGLVLAAGKGAAPVFAASPPSGFKFSVMAWTLEKQRPFEQCIEMAAQAGYQGVELVSEYADWTTGDIRRILAKMGSLGLQFDAMSGGPVTLADPHATQALLDQLEKHVKLAEQLHCRQIILTSGCRVPGLSPEAERKAMLENLSRVAELASRKGVQVVIEPIDLLEAPKASLNSVTDAFEIVRSIGSQNLMVLYDFYHEQRGAGNLLEKLEKNIDWVGLVHVADVPGRHQPGTGEINYDNIYRKLAELRYEKFIAMEFYPIGDPVQVLKAARQEAEGDEAAVSAS